MRNTANFAGALLFGLLIGAAPNGGSAVAQVTEPEIGSLAWLENAFIDPGGALADLLGAEKSAAERREERHLGRIGQGAALLADYEYALQNLREGDEHFFSYYRSQIAKAAHSRNISVRNRDVAKRLLAALPKKFEDGYAFQWPDGTVAKDPDKFVQRQLIWAQHNIFDGGSDGDAN